MYKVLIIDDEEPLREAISILGDWEGLQVGSVLEASDGRSGLELLGQHQIDIVMVDMKMPELDGVEFLKIAEREYPDLLTIVISGYDDFGYTRQAIKSKVIDYLLKPINRAELNQALRKAVNLLEERRQNEDEFIVRNITLNMSVPKLKEQIYQSLLDRSFHAAAPGNKALLPLIGADNRSSRFAAAVFRISNLDAVKRRRFQTDAGLLYFAMSNIIDGMSRPGLSAFSFASPKRKRELITVFTFGDGTDDQFAFHMDLLLKKAHSTLQELLGLEVFAGWGRVCGDILELAESYEGARSALLGLNLLDLKQPIVSYRQRTGECTEVRSLMSRMPLIRASLEAGNLNQAKLLLSEYIKQIRQPGVFRLADADRIIQEFGMLLRDTAISAGLPVSGETGESGATPGYETDFGHFDGFGELLFQMLDYYGDLLRRAAAVQAPFDAGDIKDYIDKHYFEDFKISLFTEKYYLSREYLMKRFKQQFGCGIHEYAQKVRMEKAKELLNDPNLKIQEISEMLSYRDKNYFSKAFRNYFGMSPTEYRMSQSAK